MAFPAGSTGVERDATQVLFPNAPKILSRGDDKRLGLRLERVEESKVTTLKALRDGSGPVTVKPDPDSASTLVVTFRLKRFQLFDPIAGDYPENAPTQIRHYRVELWFNRTDTPTAVERAEAVSVAGSVITTEYLQG